MSKVRIKKIAIHFMLIILTGLSVGCATSPTGRSQLIIISPDRAIADSEIAYEETIGTMREKGALINDPFTVERVARITGRLVSVAITKYPASKNWKWSVAIIHDPKTVNAWCMAGGRMAVYSGLFHQLKLTDDEFAQIMGHEISHALANHTAERMSRAMATSVTLEIVGRIAGMSGRSLSGATQLANIALELPNSRESESEADVMGMILATEAGFDPKASITLWEKMSALDDRRPADFLNTHPSPDNRQHALNSMIPKMRKLNPQESKAPVHEVTIIR